MSDPYRYPEDDWTRPSPNRSASLVGYDKALVHSILDRAYVASVAFIAPGTTGHPGDHAVALPKLYGRDGDSLYLHGSSESRLNVLARAGGPAGFPVCVTVFHVDALVIGRGAINHGVSYRSVVAYGRVSEVTDPEAKKAALATILDHVVPGSSRTSRPPDDTELGFVAVLRFDVELASAKVRTGGPDTRPEDWHSTNWAGIVPVGEVYGPPISAVDLAPGIVAPDHLHYLTEIRSHGNLGVLPPPPHRSKTGRG
ncbi:pyridoxamine 5'-phosphate oxidase family protein [Saccharothrix violaceirubra]|uniref:Pyridoxamine 5'-phosphate oxidase family protein n=1 Tax=Saccharothrix violaceirubra TaxID=413306 RepID=A0A7W7WUU8_9PSEU|nr:pyridoxamine 5'-phosphate oxidase family protein [Saccharothrix violaceirubra]MBB4964639.1 hypothetical protein [Saccharothrix violaceirubra]